MDQISELHLEGVHTELARRVRDLADKCEAADHIRIRVTQGLRTWDQQDLLYAQGRSDRGPVVTNARGGYSLHNFGLAVDIVPDQEGIPAFTPDWNAMDPRWRQVLELAKTCGLAEGAQWRTFPDRPHLYPEEVPANPTDEMRAAFHAGGLEQVWESVKLQAFEETAT